jgi:hypothetical protein
MPVSRNVSYVTTTLADRPATRGPQSITVTYPRETGAATEYSSIGPAYALPTVHLRRQQPIAMSGVSTRISERYKFSEEYLAEPVPATGCDDGCGIQKFNVASS